MALKVRGEFKGQMNRGNRTESSERERVSERVSEREGFQRFSEVF